MLVCQCGDHARVTFTSLSFVVCVLLQAQTFDFNKTEWATPNASMSILLPRHADSVRLPTQIHD